jgi:hypothetical protein
VYIEQHCSLTEIHNNSSTPILAVQTMQHFDVPEKSLIYSTPM